MKQLIKLFTMLLVILLVCASCAVRPELTYNGDGVYNGFNNIPKNYTPEIAYKDGCYVIDSKVKQGFYSDKAWTKFIEDTKKNKVSSVRIALFVEEEMFISDLFYDGKVYSYIYAGEKEKVYTYQYLLDLKGTMPNETKENRLVYLTNDKDLTFEQVTQSVLSSNSFDFLDGKFVIME